MGACGVLFVALRGPMVRLFVDTGTPPAATAELIRIGSLFLVATATFQLFDAVAMVLSGSLRGAGDTVVPGIVTVGLSWTVIVGGGEAMVRLCPGLASLGPWIAASAYITLLSLFFIGRFAGGRWKAIRLLKTPEEEARAAVEPVVDGIGPAAELAPPTGR
jgi:MATE family multidrug resistance protein